MSKNKWIADLEWINPAKQGRSERTINTILDAAESLIAEKGVDATSIANIASQAECSVGAVYHHFKDKTELQRAVFNRMIKGMEVTGGAALDPSRWEGASILDILHGYLEFSLQLARTNPERKQAVHEIAKTIPSMQALLLEQEIELHTNLRRLLMARKNEVKHPDPDLAIRFAIDQCSAILKLRRNKKITPSQTEKRSDGKIIEQTLKSVAAYLEVS